MNACERMLMKRSFTPKVGWLFIVSTLMAQPASMEIPI
jgi:hypothetical protein